jgi:hypothetical protein
VDADVRVDLAVDGGDRRYFDVGVVEGGELLLPIGGIPRRSASESW